jgi:hypothetical protein
MTTNCHLAKLAMAVAALGVGYVLDGSAASAGDAPWAAQGSPEVYKVIAENDQVVVAVATWAPGQTDKPHSHYPDRASIYLTNCKLRIFNSNGKTRDASPRAGKARLRKGEPVSSHYAQNIGDKPCKIVFVELKK